MKADKTFAENLKQRREALGLTQSDLAKCLGLSLATSIPHFETGQREPSFKNLRKLVEALNCSADSLLGIQPIVKNKTKKGS